MYGAILGDIIGSPFEFDQGNKSNSVCVSVIKRIAEKIKEIC